MIVTAKICGLSTPEAVTATLEGGASHVGFMFFEKSPRKVTPEAATRLAVPIRAKGGVSIVAVTVEPSDALLDHLAATLKPDLIQLHGKETPARVREVAQRLGCGVIKVLPVSEAADIERAADYEPISAHLMFEGKPPTGSPLPGGVGARFDWTLLAGRRFDRPWFLAGGLDAWNVTEAVRLSGAPMVDVSSGVERGPGLKDPALIQTFLDTVRRV